MVHDSEQVDPYVTPRTPTVRRPIQYLVSIVVASIVLLAISAGAFIINDARGRGIQLRRMGSAVENYLPYLERSYEVIPPSFNER